MRMTTFVRALTCASERIPRISKAFFSKIFASVRRVVFEKNYCKYKMHVSYFVFNRTIVY